jgi:D-aminopeptidase
MADKTQWESFKAEGNQVVDRLKKTIHEGNVRRVVVQQNGHTVAEFPLTAGLIGALVAPVLAAIGVLAAMIEDCSIKVERVSTPNAPAKDEARVA